MKRNKGKFNKGKEPFRKEDRELLDLPRWSKPAAQREEEAVTEAEPVTQAESNGPETAIPEAEKDAIFSAEDAPQLGIAEEENLQAMLTAESAGEDVDFNAEVEWLMQTHLAKRPALPNKELDEALKEDNAVEVALDSATDHAAQLSIAEEENLHAMLTAESAGGDVDFNAEVEWLMQTHLAKRPAQQHAKPDALTFADNKDVTELSEPADVNEAKKANETREVNNPTEVVEDARIIDENEAPKIDIKPERVKATQPHKEERPSMVYEILDWSKYILLALVIGLLITGFVVQRNEVVGISMDPTLRNQDRVWVQKLSKLWGGIERGDIVTVHGAALSDGSLQQEDLVKRVIAVSGDHLEIKDGLVYLNGELLPEPYLGNNIQTLMPDMGSLDIVVPDGQFFVMGDNRPSSKDSRYFGSINADAILGEVWFRSSPFERIGFVN